MYHSRVIAQATVMIALALPAAWRAQVVESQSARGSQLGNQGNLGLEGDRGYHGDRGGFGGFGSSGKGGSGATNSYDFLFASVSPQTKDVSPRWLRG